ncbi:MAG: hypothetical protein GKC01_06540 [Candidatus Methanofastidiosa archaeon]|nr:hypothetical protein [Candidatus Methanofastidiosa archaeon]
MRPIFKRRMLGWKPGNLEAWIVTGIFLVSLIFVTPLFTGQLRTFFLAGWVILLVIIMLVFSE